MFEPKIPVVGAVIGFALSFLIGLASGAVFHMILVRALGMGALFGGLSVACMALVGKFLPELLSGDAESVPRDPAMGTMVDVTLGDSTDSLSSLDGDASDRLPDFASAGRFSLSRSDDAPTDVEDLSSGEFVPGVTVSGSYTQGGGAERVTGSASGTAEKGPSSRPAMPVTADGLDILPDLQDFVPAARPETDEGPEAAETGFSSSTAISAPSQRGSRDFPGSDVESATMVRAIRTLLSRDN